MGGCWLTQTYDFISEAEMKANNKEGWMLEGPGFQAWSKSAEKVIQAKVYSNSWGDITREYHLPPAMSWVTAGKAQPGALPFTEFTHKDVKWLFYVRQWLYYFNGIQGAVCCPWIKDMEPRLRKAVAYSKMRVYDTLHMLGLVHIDGPEAKLLTEIHSDLYSADFYKHNCMFKAVLDRREGTAITEGTVITRKGLNQVTWEVKASAQCCY